MPINITGSWNLTGAITSSLGFSGTASYATNSLTASYALTSAGGGGGSTDTGSLLTTASAVSNVITFTKGNGSTFNVTVSTGSGGGGGNNPIAYNFTTKTLDINDNATIFPYQGFFPISSIINTGSLISIGTNAFNSLTGSYNIPNVVYIGENAFLNNTSLTGITANSCTFADNGILKGVTNLATASFTSLANILSSAFENCNIISSSGYNFGSFTGSIGTNAFKNNFNITNTDFVSGSTSLGANAFDSCTGLTRVTFPNVLLTSSYIFQNATNIISASFSSTTNIAVGAFRNEVSGSLQFLNFPSLTGSIADEAFYLQTSLVNLTPLNGATSLGSNAFRNATSIVSASFNNATSVGSTCFGDCSSLAYVSLTALSGDNALGGSPGDDSVFSNVADSGSITIPSYYSSSNSGNPDGDLEYLINTKGWTVNYI